MDEWLHAWHKYRLTHACIDGLVTCSVEGASMDHWMSSDGHNQVGWDFQTYDFDLHLYPTVLSGKWKRHTSCSTAVATSTIEASVTSGTRMDGVVHGRSKILHMLLFGILLAISGHFSSSVEATHIDQELSGRLRQRELSQQMEMAYSEKRKRSKKAKSKKSQA